MGGEGAVAGHQRGARDSIGLGCGEQRKDNNRSPQIALHEAQRARSETRDLQSRKLVEDDSEGAYLT